MDTLQLAEQIYRADHAPNHVPPWRTLPASARAEYRRMAEATEGSVRNAVEDELDVARDDGWEEGREFEKNEHQDEKNEHQDDMRFVRRDLAKCQTYIRDLVALLNAHDIALPRDPR